MEKISKPEKMAFTVKEAGAMLSLSRSSMYELIHAGKIETVKIGRARRITKGQLETFLSELVREA